VDAFTQRRGANGCFPGQAGCCTAEAAGCATKLKPGQPRLAGSDASNAWVSVYVPAPAGPGERVDLDPTNGRAPTADYVRLATGRDYSDVSPLRGVIHGGARHKLHVAVTVAQVASPTISGPLSNQGIP
jgi:transglutaminase-like putative cysteine protease